MFELQVAVLVTKSIYRTFLRGVDAGDEVEIETSFIQHILVHFGFISHQKFFQYLSILLEGIVHIANKLVVFAVGFIVEGISAGIRTEFLIASANEVIAAFQTFFHTEYVNDYFGKCNAKALKSKNRE